MVTNVVVDEIRRKKHRRVIVRVDFEKVFISSWFLYYMFERLGFWKKWIMWVKGCMKFVYIFILVKGRPTNQFI